MFRVCCVLAGFLVLTLADQMTLLQKTWLDVLYLNFAYRSSTKPGILVFSEDFKVVFNILPACLLISLWIEPSIRQISLLSV